ncbi:hypothetical protein QBC47DRAFT_181024 [Echria macrotheca]|uniref:RING-type domain-containing protein n=1 Tax=Echria macrotheca TaxID=438768 RepID=A0AAJ0BDQ4_9PEZI|nr:hypothetical protein QBC47DRAFT_181024 [Echria macrotheca]
MPASPPLTNAGEPRMPSRLHQNRRRPAASVSRSAIPSQIMDVDGLTFPTSSFSRPQNVASQSIPNSTSGGSGVARKRKRSEDPFKLEDSPGLYGETINLVDTDEVPAAKKLKKSADEIRLGAFQCVICMDDVTDLTVTHCGHVFCGECLHTALTMDQSKKICPICRQKIDPKPASGKFGVRARGFYDLKLKVAVRKTLGQPTG